jgi:hypothetical protein
MDNGSLIIKENTLTQKGQLTQKDVTDIIDNVTGGFYNVGTKNNPKRVVDSKLTRALGNGKKISTEYIKHSQTPQEVAITIRAIHPDGSFIDSTVTHYFETIMQSKLMSMLKQDEIAYKEFKSKPINKDKPFKHGLYEDLNNPFILDASGNISPNLTLKGQKKIVNDMINFKKIAIRDAETKAERRAILKLLNQEWKDPEEWELEVEEVEMVNNGKKVTHEPVKSINHESKSESIKRWANEKENTPIPQFKLKKLLINPSIKKAVETIQAAGEEPSRPSLKEELAAMLGEQSITPDDMEVANNLIENI